MPRPPRAGLSPFPFPFPFPFPKKNPNFPAKKAPKTGGFPGQKGSDFPVETKDEQMRKENEMVEWKSTHGKKDWDYTAELANNGTATITVQDDGKGGDEYWVMIYYGVPPYTNTAEVESPIFSQLSDAKRWAEDTDAAYGEEIDFPDENDGTSPDAVFYDDLPDGWTPNPN